MIIGSVLAKMLLLLLGSTHTTGDRPHTLSETAFRSAEVGDSLCLMPRVRHFFPQL